MEEPLDFRGIYEAEVGPVWNCLRRLGVPERDLDDKVHDVFVVAYRRLGDYDTSRPIRPWLLGIAARVASDYRRSARQRHEVMPRGFEDSNGRPHPDPGPEARLADREAWELVHRALETITPEHREVFVLHEIEGLPVPEIAELLAVPLNTAYSRLRLGRKQFAAAAERLQPGERGEG